MKRDMIENPLPVAGLYLHGRRSTVQHQSVQVLEFKYEGEDGSAHPWWMSVLRYVDTRRPGKAMDNPARTWAIGWQLVRGQDLFGLPVLERHGDKCVAWLVVGDECQLEVGSLFVSFPNSLHAFC